MTLGLAPLRGALILWARLPEVSLALNLRLLSVNPRGFGKKGGG